MEENVEVQTPRRRRHSAEFKAQAVSACLQPGVSVAAVALHYRLNANLLRRRVTAHEERVAGQAPRPATVPTAEFVPLHLCEAKSSEVAQDIVVEFAAARPRSRCVGL
jgi:transposase